MPRERLGYGLYVLLYTLFWIALTVIAYRTFFLGQTVPLHPGTYCFLTGLLLLILGVFRALRVPKPKHGGRDPIVASLGLSGLLLILFANLT